LPSNFISIASLLVSSAHQPLCLASLGRAREDPDCVGEWKVPDATLVRSPDLDASERDAHVHADDLAVALVDRDHVVPALL